jgi:N-acetylneuraminic acid mutarotase
MSTTPACRVCGGRWRSLTSRQTGSVPLGRSSHSAVALSGYKVAVFGGEHEPRHPIDNVVHVLDVASARWTQLAPDGPVPSARVGHAAASVGDRFYVFGGRTGVDQQETALSDFWEFDASAARWRQIEAEGGPVARSYHVMASHGDRVYVFGGCGANGRQNDLFAFDTEKQAWEELTGGPEQPAVRGGPALFATADKIYVFGGFCGKEMDDFWAYDLQARRWDAVQAQGERPHARSVTAFAALDDHHLFVFGGEVDPSAQGHAGAGDYTDETFIFDTQTLTWTKKQTEGEQRPTPRGWLAGAGLEGGHFLLFGGFDGKDRVSDLYLYSQ